MKVVEPLLLLLLLWLSALLLLLGRLCACTGFLTPIRQPLAQRWAAPVCVLPSRVLGVAVIDEKRHHIGCY